MGVACGSQAIICEYPIRFDTFTGCSHGCKYCFARNKVDIEKVIAKGSAKSLRNFIGGGVRLTPSGATGRYPFTGAVYRILSNPPSARRGFLWNALRSSPRPDTR